MSSIDNSSLSVTAWTDSGDPEKGSPCIERVVLRIIGLKSWCCGPTITRAVSRIHAINKHQLSLITAHLNLDLDTNQLSVADVIERLSAKTGYTFDQCIPSKGQTLKLVTTNIRRLQRAGLPHGVSCLEAPAMESWRPTTLRSGSNSTVLNKVPPARMGSNATLSSFEYEGESTKTGTSSSNHCGPAQIHYDAYTIGARDVFDHYRRFDPFLRLAPPPAKTTLDAEFLQRTLISFLLALAFTVPVLVLAWTPFTSVGLMYSHISLGLATAVQCITFYEVIPNATRMLYHAHMFDMEALIALGISMAYTLGVVSYVYQMKEQPLATGLSFATSTLLVTLILLSRVINEVARYKTAQSTLLRSLQTSEALLVKADPNAPMDPDPKTRMVDARLLHHGDRFKVAPHTRVVTDGVVICGGSEIDESRITGESRPVAKGVQSTVYAGTTNCSGTLIVELTTLPYENTVHRIAAMLEDMELTRPKTQVLIDQVVIWLVPTIAAISLTTFLTWLFVLRHHKNTWASALVKATTHATATLIVCSPSSIVLAVPTVILIARTVAARHGIILRNPQALKTARHVTDVVLHKSTIDDASQTTESYPTADLASKLLARGIAVHNISSEHMEERIKELQRRKGSVVLYLGNDVAALLRADIGVTSTTDGTTKHAADVVLTSPHPRALLSLLDTSSAVYRRIIVSAGWAILYNVLAVVLAAGVFSGAGVRIPLPWVGMGELVGCLPVFLVAWSMKWVGWGRN